MIYGRTWWILIDFVIGKYVYKDGWFWQYEEMSGKARLIPMLADQGHHKTFAVLDHQAKQIMTI